MATSTGFTDPVASQTMTPVQAAFGEECKRNSAFRPNGWRHFLSIFVCVRRARPVLRNARPQSDLWELLLIVPVLAFHNFDDWWLHMNAMHSPIKGPGGVLMPAYHRQRHQHHQYFAARRMTYDRNREWRIALFPPYAPLIYMLLTLPGAFIVGYLWSANAGYLLMILTSIYYLKYETNHFCCHVQDNWFVRNCPLVNTFRRHHAAQHSQQVMKEGNTNLTHPVADWYMGSSDLDRGLLHHFFFGDYRTRFVKREFATDQGDDLDARAKAA